MLHSSLKTDCDKLKENQDSLIKNLRMQLEETKEIIN